jgi:hypothetical protein
LNDRLQNNAVRILTYKRTHTDDPNGGGIFGVNNCMGQVRDYAYDAVIGIGGISSAPTRAGIDRKLTWVGVSPTRYPGPWNHTLVRFEKFLLLDQLGPPLETLAPALARRMYDGGVRFILDGYSSMEYREAKAIVEWAIRRVQRGAGVSTKAAQRRARCESKRCARKPPRSSC